MKKNDIDNKAQDDGKHVVASVLVSLMETVVSAVGVLVLLVLAWR